MVRSPTYPFEQPHHFADWLAIYLQALRSMLSTTIRPQVPSSINVPPKVTQTLVPGVEAKHGVSTDSPTVCLVLLVTHATRRTDDLPVDARTVHNNTGLSRYLDTSRRMAKFFIDHIPDDGVIPWYALQLALLFHPELIVVILPGILMHL